MREAAREASTIFQEELLAAVQRVPYVLVTLSIPAMLLLIFAGVVIYRGVFEDDPAEEPPVQETPRTIGIVNLSPDLRLPAASVPGVVAFETRQQAVRALEKGSIYDLYVVPADYLRSGSVEWLPSDDASDRREPTHASAALVAGVLRLAVAQQAELPPDVLARAMSPTDMQRTRIDDEGEPVDVDDDFDVSGFLLGFGGSMMLVFSLVIGAGALLKSVSEEKENRMIEILLTSAKPISIMMGKVFAIGLSSLFQMVVWIGGFLLIVPRIFSVFENAPQLDFDPVVVAGVIVFFLGGYFLGAVVLVGIGAITTGVREASQLSAVVILPLVSPMWFMGNIMASPEGTLATALSMIPPTAPITMILRISLGNPSAAQVLLSGAILAATGALLLWLSARVFRAGLLMYGQRMRLGQIWTALRQAGS